MGSRIVIALSLSLVSAASLAASQRIAVLPVQADPSAEGQLPRLLDEYVLTGVERAAGGAAVIGQDDILSLIGFEKQKDLLRCDEGACIADIGGALGAQRLVVVKVARIGAEWVVSSKLIDVSETRVLRRRTDFVVGESKALLQAMAGVMAQLFGAAAPLPEPAAPPAVEPPPAAAPPPAPPAVEALRARKAAAKKAAADTLAEGEKPPAAVAEPPPVTTPSGAPRPPPVRVRADLSLGVAKPSKAYDQDGSSSSTATFTDEVGVVLGGALILPRVSDLEVFVEVPWLTRSLSYPSTVVNPVDRSGSGIGDMALGVVSPRLRLDDVALSARASLKLPTGRFEQGGPATDLNTGTGGADFHLGGTAQLEAADVWLALDLEYVYTAKLATSWDVTYDYADFTWVMGRAGVWLGDVAPMVELYYVNVGSSSVTSAGTTMDNDGGYRFGAAFGVAVRLLPFLEARMWLGTPYESTARRIPSGFLLSGKNAQGGTSFFGLTIRAWI